ncbi:MAG: SUMF1/EgtB/PvdO family nonheme iron enzyme [Kofleriaceae bacterium]
MIRATIFLMVCACGGAAPVAKPSSTATGPLSLAADAQMVTVPAGKFIAGSTPEERATAYDDFNSTAHRDTAKEQKWFEGEEDRHREVLPAYRIDLLPVTQAAYAEFVTAGRAPAPAITEDAWKAQGFEQDYATVVTKFAWKDGAPPQGKLDHPVVLVTATEADAYCKWRGELAGEVRRLPTSAEYEKAARGDNGLAYPWGNTYEADKLNSAVKGPGDTVPVGQYPQGASMYGVLDMAGNVFEWTATPYEGGKRMVKGSAYEDFAGVGRGAGRHGRALAARHVIVGFRCAADAKPE